MRVYKREKPLLDGMVEEVGRSEVRSNGEDFVLRCSVNFVANQVALEL